MDEEILQRLQERYASGNLIAFVGAGVSAGAGLPTWKQLAETLCDRVRKGGAQAAVIEEIEHYISSNHLINALSAAKLALGDQEFNRTVDKELDDTGRPIPEVARMIAELKPKLRAVLTTNLDGLLERAFLGEWRMVDRPTGDLAMERRYILKLHGTLHAWDTWVFSREQYDRAIFGSPLLQEIFGALYRACSILFVGCGLADDNLDQTLGQVRALSGGQPSEHFALLPKQAISPFRRRQLEASGVRLLVYENADGRHAEVAQVLRGLAGNAAPMPPVVPKRAAAAAAAITIASAGAPIATTASSRGPVKVFFCCTERDEKMREDLERHLHRLIKEGLIVSWHAGKILAGEDKERAIAKNLDAADLILLLVSASFLASKDMDAQVTRAMARLAARRTQVVPILLRPCDWEAAPFGHLRVLPPSKDPEKEKSTPITKWDDPEEVLANIAKDLRVLVTQMRASR